MIDGKGLLSVFSKKIEYNGRFEDGQLDGDGVLYLNGSGKKLTGRWRRNIPVCLQYEQHGSKYKIEFVKVQHSDLSTIEVIITYPNKNVYEGVVTYDTKQKKYVVTGQGKLHVHDKGTF